MALQNARRAESLEQRVLIAERKHAMADLARGVSHDVNNALGAVLPLVQQLREEIEQGTLDPAVAAVDLAQIEHSIQVCRRIFGAMVHFARGTARNPSEVSLAQRPTACWPSSARASSGAGRPGRRGPRRPAAPVRRPGRRRAALAQPDQQRPRRDRRRRSVRHPGEQRRRHRSSWSSRTPAAGSRSEHLAKIQEPFFTTKTERPRARAGDLPVDRRAAARAVPDREHSRASGTRVRASFPIAMRRDAP